MLQAFTHITGIAGIALFLANFAPDAANVSLAALQPQTATAAGGSGPVNRALKGDRSPIVQPIPRPTAVSSIELVGVSQTTVILRDRFGQVLYRSDPLTNTTVASKDADIPSITVKEAPQSPTVTRSAPERSVRKGWRTKANGAFLRVAKGSSARLSTMSFAGCRACVSRWPKVDTNRRSHPTRAEIERNEAATSPSRTIE